MHDTTIANEPTLAPQRWLDLGQRPPEQVGPYRLVRILGSGGMGVVHLAEPLEPAARRLALKVIRPNLDGPRAHARFDVERQAMARLSHPNVARLFDAGRTDDGIAYVAMEFVEGDSVTRFCNRRRLDLDERLRLFTAICRGVQHIHERGIVHHDIKPSNILVGQDNPSTPKIIDFGIARALDGSLVDATLAPGVCVGTPAYMSPESMADVDSGHLLDIRTDVYALGVLLYELVTGRLPFDLSGLGPVQIAATVLRGNPPRPSARILALDAEVRRRIAERRRLSAQGLVRRLTGDLDAIIGKATARDRDRRYDSVDGLIADIERHRRHRSVSAGQPGVAYRIGRLARRLRSAAVGAAG